MEKFYNIESIKVTKDQLILTIDDKEYSFNLSDISDKLVNATDQEKNDFTISPSGYGIHWRLLDEDISINGLKIS
ncbi:MAG: DUF2442 domain-containing protein [Bacteroidota bacterium]|nr:DUF2442 domain-containing protein [Bacteroidota bacterium]